MFKYVVPGFMSYPNFFQVLVIHDTATHLPVARYGYNMPDNKKFIEWVRTYTSPTKKSKYELLEEFIDENGI